MKKRRKEKSEEINKFYSLRNGERVHRSLVIRFMSVAYKHIKMFCSLASWLAESRKRGQLITSCLLI